MAMANQTTMWHESSLLGSIPVWVQHPDAVTFLGPVVSLCRSKSFDELKLTYGERHRGLWIFV